MKSVLHEIDKEAKRLGVFIVCEPTGDGKAFAAFTAMRNPTYSGGHIICAISSPKISQEIAIIEAWERGLPFYEKVKNSDPETLAQVTT